MIVVASSLILESLHDSFVPIMIHYSIYLLPLSSFAIHPLRCCPHLFLFCYTFAFLFNIIRLLSNNDYRVLPRIEQLTLTIGASAIGEW